MIQQISNVTNTGTGCESSTYTCETLPNYLTTKALELEDHIYNGFLDQIKTKNKYLHRLGPTLSFVDLILHSKQPKAGPMYMPRRQQATRRP